ncbi:hypothetical protein TTHERM_00001370 (macronuclear) [Tetrahymena thermophila SB210]|uniref:Uncharacterized protein n=1 Tax=Tetrahymena thermophila (strain SB210) TaxID=312017 RepID=Q22SK0_TETTS|nr:hypothetical protein TTHERM_00001370 [Tetrahymena thermophila SB210]EAR87772.1 hypothetical protein TTHERM_00001370 [Tetrahymena thermophila SB210]|eukprot:XP_001008017.1 hypothetical protein TTHERM_00001370 [Tetrahymena thermophila SB210]
MGNCLTSTTVVNQPNTQTLKEAEEREFEGEVTYVRPFYKGIVVRSAPTVEQLEKIFLMEEEQKRIKKQQK